MGSQGGGGSSNDNQPQFEQLMTQNSMYSLTLDEVQNQLGDLGKPLSSMNLDELLKNVWTVEANQSVGTDIEPTSLASLSITGDLSKKTVDQVWKDIQQSKTNEARMSRERQPTLGEMTLEDFLVKAGVVTESLQDKKNSGQVTEIDPHTVPQFPQHNQWMQFPQHQYPHAQQSMMGVYMPSQPMPQPLHMAPSSVIDVSYPENQVALPSPLMGTLSDTPTPGRKRSNPDNILEKTVERKQKRMIKNRESAARSRARKQAYTTELENKVSRLEEENEKLRERKELEQMLPIAPPQEPKFQLRRTTSATF